MTAQAGGLSMYTRAQSSRGEQDRLVEQYAPLVKRIAYHLLGRLPSSVQVEDLMQAGMIGLLEASRKFDFGKGASFETYAGIRIRGAMLDEVRCWMLSHWPEVGVSTVSRRLIRTTAAASTWRSSRPARRRSA